ncbi:MAG: prepilin-type N-terminal cleavage/methylation domain-containing protein [Lentisphaerae bacterium]|nr:prepilin-type N-terminal cleavage/methylation domain-containing protein [Lentisphaerota bacterium]
MHSRAFTLLELLIVVAILSVVIGVVAACLTSGMRVWEEARAFSLGEAEADLALIQFERDVRNMFPFYGIPFEGEAEAVTLSGRVGREDSPDRPGGIRYRFDRAAGALLRETWPFPAAGPEPRPETLVDDVAQAALDYFVVPPGEGASEGQWMTQTTNMPRAVRLSLRLGGSDETLVRTAVRE